eukprot:gene2431-3165_t
MYNASNNSSGVRHDKAWMALEVIDGLRNEDVVVMITSSEIGGFRYLRESDTRSQDLDENCTNQYYGGEGPCCKVDDVLTYLTMERPE